LSVEQVLSFGTRDGSRPVAHQSLLFEPGRYTLGFAFLGTGHPFSPPVDKIPTDGDILPSPTDLTELPKGPPWSMELAKEKHIGTPVPSNKHLTRETAWRLAPNRGWSTPYLGLPETWATVEVAESQADSRWTLAARVPVGRKLAVTLFDPAGVELISGTTNALGQLQLRDLGLAPGTYHMRINGTKALGVVSQLKLTETGVRVAGEEVEPNNAANRANQITVGSKVTGRSHSKNDYDYFEWVVDEDQAEKPLSIDIDCAKCTTTLSHGTDQLQKRTFTDGGALEDLALPAGIYHLRMSGQAEGAEYAVHLKAMSALPTGHEPEPNDTPHLVAARAPDTPISGHLTASDTDIHRVAFSGEAQLWRLLVLSDTDEAPNITVTVTRPAGKVAAKRKFTSTRRSFSGLYLTPGVHTVTLTGPPQNYTLKWVALGPLTDAVETEPNNVATQANPLLIGKSREGLLDPGDTDCYRFSLRQEQRIALDLRAPLDGAVKLHLNVKSRSDREAPSIVIDGGASGTLDLTLRPHDYQACVTPAKEVPEGEYTLGLRALDWLPATVDREPNLALNGRWSVVPQSLVVEGRLDSSANDRSDDWLLPPHSAGRLVVELTGASAELPELELGVMAKATDDPAGRVRPEYLERIRLARDPEAPEGVRRFTAMLTGQPTWLSVTLPGSVLAKMEALGIVHPGAMALDYQISLAFEAGPAPVPLAEPVRLTSELQTSTIAAFHEAGQELTGQLTVNNDGGQTATVRMDAIASEPGWQVLFEASDLTVGPSGSASGRFRVLVPPDVRAERPVRLTLRAYTGGSWSTHTVVLTPVNGVMPVNPRAAWPLPASLLGSLNVAWSDGIAPGKRKATHPAPLLSARWTGESAGIKDIHALNNGLALFGHRAPNLSRGRHANNPTVEFLGTEPVSIVGIGIVPLGRDNRTWLLRDFLIELSMDGEHFTQVLQGTLDGSVEEQVFVLPEPTQARFARLIPLTDAWGRDGMQFYPGSTSLGEWKVLAAPGAGVLGEVDLANPTVGGHTLSSKGSPGYWSPQDFLRPNDRNPQFDKRGGPSPWMIGFHHDRAARVQRIEWVDHPDCSPEQRPQSVTVEASVDSGIGPWVALAPWTRSDPGAAFAPLQLDGTWARFLRFSVPEKDKTKRCYPDLIKVIEMPESETYRSILGEWGHNNPKGPYEWQNPTDYSRETVPFRDDVIVLKPTRSEAGRVQRGKHEDRYTIKIPGNHNTLTVDLTGEPSLAVVPQLFDARGNRVPIAESEEGAFGPRKALWQATVQPGATYEVRIVEPPSSIVYTWDTSLSTVQFHPIIFQSLLTLADVLQPGEEAVNLLPFGGKPLFNQWISHPELLRQYMAGYRNTRDSSDAMGSAARAADALSVRYGTRAILLLTDGASPPNGGVWKALSRGQPRVFAMGVTEAAFGTNDGNPFVSQDGLQDLASANSGTYDYVYGIDDIEHSMARGLAWLRRPVTYAVTADTQWIEPPVPGTLAVVRPEDGEGLDAGAIEIIFDASGSMYKKIDGRYRIDVARELLTEVVTTALPEETPVAMRVFGHREAKSCRTDLELPVGPLNHEALSQLVAGIEPQKLSRTPLADSILAVADDLKDVTGPKTVLMLTDGKESCKGDPGKAIATLQAQGLHVQVNIVGLALKKKWKGEFASWAEQSGGRYLDASDPDTLRTALTEILAVQYVVLNEAGQRVTSGSVDGEPVELMPGKYTVRVLLAQPKTYEVVISDGSDSKLEVR
jgi:hypothetical protein